MMDHTTHTILLVDDDKNFRQGVKRVLFTMRHEVEATILEADSADGALQLLASNPVDLVMLDYLMPGTNGLECLKRIHSQYPVVQVVIVTGQGSEDIAVEAMKSGAIDYLVKGSISPENLFRSISTALRQAALERTIEAQAQALLHAERQRAMIQSLGAACHHLGQPATVISTYLSLLRDRETRPENLEMIEACIKATESMKDIFERLRNASEFRTEPYLTLADGAQSRLDDHILQL